MQAGPQRLADLQAIETILTLNEAFCQHHRAHCVDVQKTVGSANIVAQCEAVQQASEELRAELWRVGSLTTPDEDALCQDRSSISDCKEWVRKGECVANAGVMQ